MDTQVHPGGLGLYGWLDIKGHARLGAAVVHIPTHTAIYIDATSCEEKRTIMRAELIAIHTTLTRFYDHPWLGSFTNSLSIKTIRLYYKNPGLSASRHYHHHMLLLKSISDLLETRRENHRSTTLREIRASTHIRSNDLADAAATLAVTNFDTISPEHTYE